MENRKPIIVSLIAFLIAITLIAAYVRVKRNELTADFGEEVPVVVANVKEGDRRYIPEYSIIHASQLEVKYVFKKFRQPQTVSSIEDVVGKATYVPIYDGEQVTLTKLVHQDGKPVLDRQVAKKMRAVTVQISPHTGVGRMIRPGNRVDVMAAVSYEANDQLQMEVKTIFQNILVLATGKVIQNSIPARIDKDALEQISTELNKQDRKDLYTTYVDPSGTSRPDDNYTSLTLQMTPEDSEKLLFLQHTIGDNRLYFALRNGGDQEVAKLDTTLLDSVLGPDSDYGRTRIKPQPATPARPRYYDSSGGKPVPVY